MPRATRPCIVCGEPSLVRVLAGYTNGEPVFRSYCHRCAASEDVGPSEITYSHLPRLLMWTGALIGVVSVSADYLGLTSHQGFGWRQFAGAEAGVLFMVLGAFFRATPLSLGGACLFALSVGADVINLGRFSGVGWRQTLAAIVALVLVGCGLLMQRRARAAETGHR